jgi:hypothetical protein
MQSRLSSTGVLIPAGRCPPKPARSSAHEKHELLQAFVDDCEEHHEPRRERSAPQQCFYRSRHKLPPKMTVSNKQKVTDQNPIAITLTKIIQAQAI